MTPFLRQLMIAGMLQLAAISTGGAVSYPSVLLSQLSSNDSTIQLDLDTASWIGSVEGIAGLPSILLPMLMQWKGRKVAFIGSCLISIVGWAMAFFAVNSIIILVSESFHGLGTHSLLAVGLLSASEMINPRYRNVSMISFHIMQGVGMTLVAIFGRYLHWKTTGLIMGSPLLIAILLAIMGPESPAWLACKGEFTKCEKAFISLRGTDDIPRKEMLELISAQKENLLSNKRKHKHQFKQFWQTLTSRDFYLPSFHMFVLLNLMYWSGSSVIIIYSIQMIQQVTTSADVAFYGIIIINSVLLVCVTISSGLIRRYNNKPVVLLSNLGTSVCLMGISVLSYLQTVGIVSKESWICLYFLIAYVAVNGLGMMPIVFIIAAELMPVKHRGVGGALYIIFTCALHTSSLKLAPYLFVYITFWGTFLLFGCNSIVCGLFIWKYLPETKGRTLQEIEDFYMTGNFKKRNMECEM